MPIWQYAMRAPMPSFLPHTTTPKLAAYIYTPARVPAGPRCPAAHGLAHRAGVPFFCLGAASLQWLDRACGGASKPCWRSRARARRHVGGALALGPPPRAGLAALHAWSPQHVRSFSNMASRPNHRQFAGRPCAMGGLIGHRRRGGLLAW